MNAVSSASNIMGLATAGTSKKQTEGSISIVFLKDPTDPHWAKDPGVKLYRSIMKKYKGGNPNDVYTVYGMSVAHTFVDGAEEGGQEPDAREHHEGGHAPERHERPVPAARGSSVKTGAGDHFPLDQAKLERYHNGHWVSFGGLFRVEVASAGSPAGSAHELAAPHRQQADHRHRHRDADPLRPAQRRVEDVDADQRVGDRKRQLAERRRAAPACAAARSSRARARGSRSRTRAARSRRCRAALDEGRRAHDRQRAGRARPARRRSGRSITCSKREPPAQEAAEHGAHRPEAAAASVSAIGIRPVRVRVERVRQRDQPDAEQRRRAGTRRSRGRGCSPSMSHGADDRRSAAAPSAARRRVMKSPWKSASVKRIVAIAEAPAPTAMPAAT